MSNGPTSLERTSSCALHEIPLHYSPNSKVMGAQVWLPLSDNFAVDIVPLLHHLFWFENISAMLAESLRLRINQTFLEVPKKGDASATQCTMIITVFEVSTIFLWCESALDSLWASNTIWQSSLLSALLLQFSLRRSRFDFVVSMNFFVFLQETQLL